ARRQAPGVVAALAHLLFGLRAEERHPEPRLTSDGRRYVPGGQTAAVVRAGQRPGRRGPAPAAALERRLGADVRSAAPDAEGPCDRAARRLAARLGGLPAPDRAGARRDRPGALAESALPRALRGRARAPLVARRLRRRGSGSEPRLRRAGGLGGRAREDADPRRHAAVRTGARRPGAAGRGRPRRARGLVHEGVLPRPGAGRPASLPRPREPRAPGPPARGRRAPRVRRRADVGRQSRRPGDERGAPRRRRRRARLRPNRGAGGRRAPRRGAWRTGATLGPRAPVAQGIERSPAEAEARGSNPLGRKAVGETPVSPTKCLSPAGALTSVVSRRSVTGAAVP